MGLESSGSFPVCSARKCTCNVKGRLEPSSWGFKNNFCCSRYPLDLGTHSLACVPAVCAEGLLRKSGVNTLRCCAEPLPCCFCWLRTCQRGQEWLQGIPTRPPVLSPGAAAPPGLTALGARMFVHYRFWCLLTPQSKPVPGPTDASDPACPLPYCPAEQNTLHRRFSPVVCWLPSEQRSFREIRWVNVNCLCYSQNSKIWPEF